MTLDMKIAGATLYDGSGAAPITADIGIAEAKLPKWVG